jgi:hypothetical protein
MDNILTAELRRLIRKYTVYAHQCMDPGFRETWMLKDQLAVSAGEASIDLRAGLHALYDYWQREIKRFVIASSHIPCKTFHPAALPYRS